MPMAGLCKAVFEAPLRFRKETATRVPEIRIVTSPIQCSRLKPHQEIRWKKE